MAELHLATVAFAHEPRALRLTHELASGETALFTASDEGEVTPRDLARADATVRLLRELRRPSSLVGLIEDQEGERRWRAARLLLAAWETMRARGELDRGTDQWTRALLLALQARASLRVFASAEAADTRPWDDHATRDLLDAAAALGFFEPRRLAPFLQWLVAVLGRARVRALVDELLPVDPAFVSRLTEGGHRELGRIVQGVAHSQRRQYFFGRYDLRGAGRLRSLLSRLRHPRSGLSARVWSCWLFVADRFVPRLFAGCVVGILPFLLTEEAWRLVSELSMPRVAGLSVLAAVAVVPYLCYDRYQADPAGLSPRSGVVWVWLTGVVESLVLAAGVQWLATPSFLEEDRFNPGVFLASAAFALAVGVFTQLIWQEKAVTAPP